MTMKILKLVDLNEDGFIGYSEFITAAMDSKKLLSKEKIINAFNTFDLNGDGFISKDELKAIMGGIEMDEETW